MGDDDDERTMAGGTIMRDNMAAHHSIAIMKWYGIAAGVTASVTVTSV